MKIAFHHRPGSFSDRWIEYCKDNQIAYKLVNAYDSDIIQQVADCDAFMWHHSHVDYRDTLLLNNCFILCNFLEKSISGFYDRLAF